MGEAGVYCFRRVDVPSVIPDAAVSGDLDGDGHAELVVREAEGISRVTVQGAEPTAQVQFVPVDDATWAKGLATAVFEPGGPEEAVTFAYGVTLRHRLASGAMSTMQEPRDGDANWGGMQGLEAAIDVDGDQTDELIAIDAILHEDLPADEEHAVLVVLRRDAGAWTMQLELPSRYQQTNGSPIAADFDRDDRAELLIAGDLLGIYDQLSHNDYDPARHQVVALRSTGSDLMEYWRGPAGTVPYQIKTGDFDADGVLDLVVRSRERVAVLRGAGDGTFGEPRLLDLGDYPQIAEIPIVQDVTTGDFDGDGRAEVAALVRGAQDGGARYDIVFVRDALGAAEAQPLQPSLADGGGAFVVADVNSDGFDDLAIRTETLSLLISDP